MDEPDPLLLRGFVAMTGVPTARCLMVGDTEYDAAMAQALGMPMLGVACGVHDAGRLLRFDAVAVVENAAAIPAWLAERETSDFVADRK